MTRARHRAPVLLSVWLTLALSFAAAAVTAVELRVIPDADLSGLEPLGQAAIHEAREQLRGGGGPATQANHYARLGALYQRFDINHAAAVCWANARALQPDDYRWPYYQGWLALNNGHMAQALKAFRQAQALNPDYAPPALRIGQVWLSENQLPQAQQALETAADQPGLRAAALYYLGQIAVLQRDYPEAERRLTEALRLDPEAAAVHYPLAQAYRGLGKRQQARAELALFAGHSPDQTPRVDDPLVEHLQQVIKRSDESFNNAMQAVRSRDYPAAVAAFEQGLAIDPDNDNARISYARALYLADRDADAREQLARVLEQQADADADAGQRDKLRVQQALAAFLLGLLADEQQQGEQADRHYRLALTLQPEHPGAHYFLAHRLFHAAQYRAAASHYRAAYRDTDLPPARLLAIVAEQLSGDPDPVIAKRLAALIAAHPQHTELQYAMVRLRALSNDPQVHDDVAAVEMANRLVQQQARPLNLELLALAAAANGQYSMAAEILEHVEAMPAWNRDPGSPSRVARDLAAYRQGRMPEQAIWPPDHPLLSPPPLDPSQPFREYLSATPF